MRYILRNASLAAQLILLAAACLVLVATSALLVVERHSSWRLASSLEHVELVLVLSTTALTSLALIVAAVRHLLRPLHQLRDAMTEVTRGNLVEGPTRIMPNRELRQLQETFNQMVDQLRKAKVAHDQAQAVLSSRSHSVDRILEFSQTIQGAGQSDQVFAAMAHFIHRELSLKGLLILTHQPEAIPPLQVKVALPPEMLRPDNPVAEMEPALCPCLRQNLHKEFSPGNSPIRCAIDSSINLTADHPAYCIPFHVGRNLQGVVHMLLPIGELWTEDRSHLAETYVHSAVSALISLHHIEEAEKQSLTDSLTGLYNRHSMEHLLQREVALSERHGHDFSLAMIDMDQFKQINDAHGHAAGDHLLRAFADCVRMTLRKTDFAFRYGGDEFLIALPQTPMVQAQQVVQKLRQAFAAADFSHAITRLDHQPTLSIGVAERSKATNVLTLPNLLTAADSALYEAKSDNRNCVKIYQPPKAA